jgi:hypothetical protein
MGAAVPAETRAPGANAPPDRTDAGPVAPAAQWLELAPELRHALSRAAGAASHLRVVLDSAVQPGLALQTDRRALRAALDGMLEQAMQAAAGGKVLLTGRRDGWMIELAVLDDGPGTDAEIRRGALRPVDSAIALQGGSLEISAVAAEGTTMRLRLPAPAAARVAPSAALPTSATSTATASERGAAADAAPRQALAGQAVGAIASFVAGG